MDFGLLLRPTWPTLVFSLLCVAIYYVLRPKRVIPANVPEVGRPSKNGPRHFVDGPITSHHGRSNASLEAMQEGYYKVFLSVSPICIVLTWGHISTPKKKLSSH